MIHISLLVGVPTSGLIKNKLSSKLTVLAQIYADNYLFYRGAVSLGLTYRIFFRVAPPFNFYLHLFA